MSEAEHYMNYMKGKGKGKGKFKSKSSYPAMMEAQASSKSKGKGKYGKNKSAVSRPSVNAYTMYDLGGLEIESPEFSLAATQKGSDVDVEPKSSGMLDCGATASAAPDVSVRGLISAILTQDNGAEVQIDPYLRPHFRFGNGRWGQALYRVTISSRVSGQQRKFSLYSLPNPEVMNQHNIVPILVGMDHLGPHGCQMLIDFGHGYVIDGVDPNPQIYQLETNNKGHYVYDIIYHLTRGFSSNKGPARVHVSKKQFEQSMVLQFRPLEFYHAHVQQPPRVSSQSCEQRQALLWQLYEHSRPAATKAAQMCTTALSNFHDDISFRDSLRHGLSSSPFTERCCRGPSGDRDQEQDEPAQAQVKGPAIGSKQNDHPRPEGSWGTESMAVLQPAQSSRDLAQQRPRQLAALPGVRFEVGIHPQEGLSKQLHDGSQPCDGRPDADGVGASHAGQDANTGHLQGHDGQDHRRDAVADSDRCSNSRTTSSCAGPKAQVQEQGQERLPGDHFVTGQPSKLGSHAGRGGTVERRGEEQSGQSSSRSPCNAAGLHDGCVRECGGTMKSSRALLP